MNLIPSIIQNRKRDSARNKLTIADKDERYCCLHLKTTRCMKKMQVCKVKLKMLDDKIHSIDDNGMCKLLMDKILQILQISIQRIKNKLTEKLPQTAISIQGIKNKMMEK